MDRDEMIVFGGSGSQRLSRKICAYLGMEPGEAEVLRFSEGNLFVRLLDNVRGKSALIVDDVAISGGTLVDMASSLDVNIW